MQQLSTNIKNVLHISVVTVALHCNTALHILIKIISIIYYKIVHVVQNNEN